jgi:hypothetical protein
LKPLQPLVPQKTGPPPPVRFGVTETKKLTPQATGRRANLSQASKFCLVSNALLLPLLTSSLYSS